ncbi:MAG: hypothetical protein HYR49_01145 [Gammaproteobacteria bacterium]|nr:hypothetical protein [Gammaproteobacteria bacterium]
MGILAVLAGCNGSGVKSRLTSLDEAINAYAQALRWGRYDDAQQFHLTRNGDRVALDETMMKDIRITAYAVRNTKFDEKANEADVQAEFKYFITNRGTLQTKLVPQKWWYEEESKRWLLESGLPDFTVATEPQDKPARREPRIREVPRDPY